MLVTTLSIIIATGKFKGSYDKNNLSIIHVHL